MTDDTTTARRAIYRSTAQKLTDTIREFLERQPFAMLATHSPDNSIHVVPLSYMFEKGRFFFASSSSSRKARNLAARPEATVTVTTAAPSSEPRRQVMRIFSCNAHPIHILGCT